MPFSRLRYHLVWGTKHHEPLIAPEMEELLRATLFHHAESIQCKIIVVGNVANHIHLILAVPPSQRVSDVVRELKTATSRAIRRGFPIGDYFSWQKGYGIFTLRADDFQDAVNYVVHQKEHHAKDKLIPIFERWEE